MKTTEDINQIISSAFFDGKFSELELKNMLTDIQKHINSLLCLINYDEISPVSDNSVLQNIKHKD